MAETDKKLWFKARRYGYGWTPTGWQGWLVIFVYAGLAVALATMTMGDNKQTTSDAFVFFTGMLLLTILLIVVGYKKGERPRWRWGGK